MTLALAEALLSCGALRREEIPPVAVDLLESGTDTQTVRELAGLRGAELSQAHDLLRRVLHELQRPTPSRSEAAKIIARDLASQVVAEGADVRALARRGAEFAVALDYHPALMPFYVADDEYHDAGMWSPHQVTDRLRGEAKSLLDAS